MGKPHYCTYARRSEAAISRSPQEVERSRKKSQGVERSHKQPQEVASSRKQLQAATSSRKQPQEAASSRKKSQAVASSCSRSHGSGQGRCQGRCQRRPQSESCLSTAALLPPASTGRQRWRTRQRACAAWASPKSGRGKTKGLQKRSGRTEQEPPLTQREVSHTHIYIYTHKPGCPHMARAAPVAVTSVLLLGPILAAAQSHWPETADTGIRARVPHYPGPPN